MESEFTPDTLEIVKSNFKFTFSYWYQKSRGYTRVKPASIKLISFEVPKLTKHSYIERNPFGVLVLITIVKEVWVPVDLDLFSEVLGCEDEVVGIFEDEVKGKFQIF